MIEIKEGYKKSEIGIIPNEWEVVKLGDIGKSIIGLTYSPSDVVNNSNNAYLVLRSSNVQNSNILLENNVYVNKNIPKNLIVKKGDILICSRNGSKNLIGKNAYISKAQEGYTFGAFMTIYRSKYSKYVYQLLKTNLYQKQINNNMGATINQITTRNLNSFKFPFPPLKEQRKIADILSNVDEKIDIISNQIEKVEILKKGLMQKLLNEGIGHNRFKDSELGKIPESWEIKYLSEIGLFSKGKGISKNEIIDNGIPCMRYAEIYTKYNTVLKNIKSFINKKSALNSKQIYKGDILFAGSGETLEDIGKSVAFLDDFEACVGGDTIILSPNIDYNSLFMSYQLNTTSVRIQLRKLGQGNSVVHIYSSGLKKVFVAFPPLQEQKEIADILSTTDEKIEILKAKKQKYETLKKGLLQKLLSGEIRVV